jgi:hypothetical protein
VFALAVAVAAILGLWFQATLPVRLPTPTDWKAAATLIAREARPGDAVALAPAWAERGREVLPEAVPARPEIPLPVLAYPSYAERDEDLTGIRRVWLLSLPDAPGGAGPAASQLAARAGTVEGPVRLGRLELTRYDLKSPLLPLWSLADRLFSASIQPGDATVSRETREVGFLPRTCLLVRFHGPRASPAVVRLPSVPLGAALRGHVGLAGDLPDGRVTVRVKIDGVEAGRADASAGSQAWVPFVVDTARLPPVAHDVELEIFPSGPLPRGVCVELVALP